MAASEDGSELVVVDSAPDAVSDELLAGRLRSEGIPAEVLGSLLVDAWAVSQRGMGLLGVEVWVPRGRLEDARRLFASLPGAAAPVAAAAVAAVPDEGATPPPGRPRRALLAELVVVILVAFAPSWTVVFLPVPLPEEFVTFAISSIVRDTGLAALGLLLMARSGEGLAAFGVTRPRWLADPAFGVVLFGVSYTLVRTLPLPIAESDPPWWPPAPRGALQHLASAGELSLSAFMQELIARGYLIVRLESLLGSRWRAVGLAALLFASWHLYQGLPGVLSALFLGLIFGGVFCGLRRIWPLVIAHALWLALALW